MSAFIEQWVVVAFILQVVFCDGDLSETSA